MTTLLQRGYTFAAGALPLLAGQTAALDRAGATASLTVVTTSPQAGVVNESGLLLSWEGVDLLCKATDYAPGGTVAQPAPGDRLTVGTAVYEVMQPAMGQPCFRYRDPPGNTLLRIHTKQVA